VADDWPIDYDAHCSDENDRIRGALGCRAIPTAADAAADAPQPLGRSAIIGKAM
jgi:hypothetical protein